MRYLMSGLVITTVLVSICEHGEAAVLSARKDKAGNPVGDVAIRAACKTNETALNPVALELRGPKGDPGPQGPPG